jgi:hypothetical protein
VWVAVRQTVEAEHTDGRNAPGEPDASPGLYTLERREIGTGASTVSRIEVVSGLAEGELVVSDRLQEMSDGLVVSGGSLL